MPLLLALAFFWLGASSCGSDPSSGAAGQAVCPPSSPIRYEIQEVIRRSQPGFTEGLVVHSGSLFESSGGYGSSQINRIDPISGQVSAVASLPANEFGEGLDFWRGSFAQLTWKENTILSWPPGFDSAPQHRAYPREGWGLTHTPANWIASNGTSTLYILAPEDFSERGTLEVKREDQPETGLNELEFAEGFIYANVFGTDRIDRIDPLSGCVTGTLDLSQLRSSLSAQEAQMVANDGEAVLNGIAYDPEREIYYVTGKTWPLFFWVHVSG